MRYNLHRKTYFREETEDAQKIADLILNEAIDNNFGVAKDDMSVIVCRFLHK